MTFEFYNPYNFVSTPTRNLDHDFCGDYDPSDPSREEDHSRYWARRYSGTIPVKISTNTPLFITDPGSKTPLGDKDLEHYCYDCLDYIPATSLKGMISAAYEAITNSRFRIFSQKQHEKRLGYRLTANATLVPGMISIKDDGVMCVKLFPGGSQITDDGPRAGDPLYAAWLPMSSKVEAGYYKEVELQLCHYKKPTKSRDIEFDLWFVRSIKDIGATFEIDNHKCTPLNCERPIVAGYVYRSGQIIANKHYERFFFYSGEPKELRVSKDIRERYEDLIKDYQYTHREVDGKRINPPNDCDLGEHITEQSRAELRDGDFVYVKTGNNGGTVVDLYPVQISRELCRVSPWDCLDEELRPADDICSLSPADRLFGWVSQGKTGSGVAAWRGKVRISNGRFVAGDGALGPVQRFKEPLPLSILGAPKPAQDRFYLGDDKDGCPQPSGSKKERASYTTGKRLRGRKVYLHHTLHYLDDKDKKTAYWVPSDSSIPEGEREYSRFPKGKNSKVKDEKHTNQNRSITGWIPKTTTEKPIRFGFNISFDNLTEVELGALLALLMLSDEQCWFRLGLAKPLGLGSVRLAIDWGEDDSIPVCTGYDMAERYKTIGEYELPRLGKGQANSIRQAYQRAVVCAYGDGTMDAAKSAEQSDLPWEREWAGDPKKYEFIDYVKGEDEAAFTAFVDRWRRELDALVAQRKAPKDPQPPIEGLELDEIEEAFPGAIEKLREDFASIVKERRESINDDFGWSALPFIAELKQAMKGYSTDARVCYPRNGGSDLSEGFKWFVGNESKDGDKLSLPLLTAGKDAMLKGY